MNKTFFKVLFSKGSSLAFAFIYTSLVMLGATFSWVTSSEQKANEFKGEARLKTVIVEDFTGQSDWKPGEDIKKIVSVYNDGESSGYVRISFEEIIKAFTAGISSQPSADPDEDVMPELMTIANESEWQNASAVFGSVVFMEGGAPVTAPADVAVKVKPSSSGGYSFLIYQIIDGTAKVYRRMTAQFDVKDNNLTVSNPRYWGYADTRVETEAAWGVANETAAPVTPPVTANINKLISDTGKNITINYSNILTTLSLTAADNGKWFYHQPDGFFYYIGKLDPMKTSNTLMTGLSLGTGADIIYSSMNLQFIVNLESLQVSKSALKSEWGLNESDPLYQALAAFS